MVVKRSLFFSTTDLCLTKKAMARDFYQTLVKVSQMVERPFPVVVFFLGGVDTDTYQRSCLSSRDTAGFCSGESQLFSLDLF